MVRFKGLSTGLSWIFSKVSIPQWFDSKLWLLGRISWHCFVSIPQWFDSKVSIVKRNTIDGKVSIPQWFDSKQPGIAFDAQNDAVSIPQWFDSKKWRMANRHLRGSFQSHNGSIQRKQDNGFAIIAEKFQSHNGSIQSLLARSKRNWIAPFQSHNGSIQRQRRGRHCECRLCFNPTMVRFKVHYIVIHTDH